MTTDPYRHQRQLFDPDLAGRQHVTIVGAGSIGGHLIALLASMGVRTMDVWDADKVEEHNLPVLNGIYRPEDIGTYKVEAAVAFLERQKLPTRLTPHAEFVTSSTPLNGVVFACTDSMASRRATFEAVMANLGAVPHLWDLRVGRAQIKTVRLSPSDTQAVECYSSPRYLPDDSKVKQLACGQRMVIDSPAVVAAYAVGQFRLWAQHAFVNSEEVMPPAVVIQDLDAVELIKSNTL